MRPQGLRLCHPFAQKGREHVASASEIEAAGGDTSQKWPVHASL